EPAGGGGPAGGVVGGASGVRQVWRAFLRGGLRAGHLDLVRGALDVDALAGALLGRVDHVQPKAVRYVDPATRGKLQFSGVVLDVGESVDVELEDLGRVLHAQPVAGAQVLIHPYTQSTGLDTHDFHGTRAGDTSSWVANSS